MMAEQLFRRPDRAAAIFEATFDEDKKFVAGVLEHKRFGR
jgi:hypothetical protein